MGPVGVDPVGVATTYPGYRGAMFADRIDAGRRLAEELAALSYPAPHVFGLARGGVPVAAEVAARIGAPLDVVIARKVGLPGRPEFAIGAVAESAREVVWGSDIDRHDLDEALVQLAVEKASDEVAERVQRYRHGRVLPELDPDEVTAIVVDDGLATGATAEAALRAVQTRDPRELVLAVPVCSPSSAERLSGIAEVVCLESPDGFRAVGQFYDDFSQTTDDEVERLLTSARSRS